MKMQGFPETTAHVLQAAAHVLYVMQRMKLEVCRCTSCPPAAIDVTRHHGCRVAGSRAPILWGVASTIGWSGTRTLTFWSAGWPNCPYFPPPQVNREPSEASANECVAPAAHDTMRWPLHMAQLNNFAVCRSGRQGCQGVMASMVKAVGACFLPNSSE
jgi:hypothetical protein